MKKLLSAIAGAMLVAAPALQAQTLLTAAFGGTKATDIIATCPSGPCPGVGPTSIGTNGFIVTYTANNSRALLSGPGGGTYGLGTNGAWQNLAYAATNDRVGNVRFTFGSAVSSVGGWMNYAPGFGAPTISAFDGSNILIASYDLSILAPIITSGTDQSEFRGISYAGGIKSFEIGGSYILTQDLSAGITTVPEPTTMVLMGAGLLGLVALRRRQRAS